MRDPMVLGALERWRSNWNWGFGFAVIAFLGAFALRYAVSDWLPTGVPFITFFPAIILVAFFAGLWPSVLLTFLSALAAWYFFLPPAQSVELNADAAFALAAFALIAAIMVVLIHALTVAIDRLRDQRARAQLLAQQRETMFAELQHRISNNLQLVAALLNLETHHVTDQRALKALDEASKRLTLIGKLHRNLYDPEGTEIDFGVFLKTLCDDVVSAWNARNVKCLVKSIEVTLPAEQSIPVALIAAELMSNALEHGLKDRPHGKIDVNIRRDGANAIILEVADDGHGLPPDFDVAAAKSLGLSIVQNLTEQLDGRFEIQGESGTICRIVIPCAHVGSTS